MERQGFYKNTIEFKNSVKNIRYAELLTRQLFKLYFKLNNYIDYSHFGDNEYYYFRFSTRDKDDRKIKKLFKNIEELKAKIHNLLFNRPRKKIINCNYIIDLIKPIMKNRKLDFNKRRELINDLTKDYLKLNNKNIFKLYQALKYNNKY